MLSHCDLHARADKLGPCALALHPGEKLRINRFESFTKSVLSHLFVIVFRLSTNSRVNFWHFRNTFHQRFDVKPGAADHDRRAA